MTIPLIEANEMITGRGGGKKKSGERYSKYKNAIAPHVEFLKDEVAKSKDGNIRVLATDLAKTLNMTGKHETSIYWGLKYVLFAEGLVVTTGQTKSNDAVLIIRERKEGDVLPTSLTKTTTTTEATEADEVDDEDENLETDKD